MDVYDLGVHCLLRDEKETQTSSHGNNIRWFI